MRFDIDITLADDLAKKARMAEEAILLEKKGDLFIDLHDSDEGLFEIYGSDVVKHLTNRCLEILFNAGQDKYKYVVFKTNSIKLNEYSSIIYAGEKMNFVFVLSCDRSIVFKILETLCKESDFHRGEWDLYAKSAVAEFSNIILGNSIKHLGVPSNLIKIGIPVPFRSTGVEICATHNLVSTMDFDTEFGKILLAIISNN